VAKTIAVLAELVALARLGELLLAVAELEDLPPEELLPLEGEDFHPAEPP
jgi:hypothetical protein